MAKSSAWGIKQGLIFASVSVLGLFIVSEAVPRPELKPILYGLAGICAVTGIGSGIKYELSHGDYSEKPKVRRKREHSPVRRRESPLVCSSNPMAELAQRAPSSMGRFLKRQYQKTHYENEIRGGSKLVQNYLGGLPSNEYPIIKKIRIHANQQKAIFGIPFGRRTTSIDIKK